MEMMPGWQRDVMEVLDWVLQALLLFLALGHPFIAARGRSERVFLLPLILGVAWGIWRVAAFDPAMNNDVIGIGYLVSSVVAATLGLLLYHLRRFVSK